MRCLAGVNAPTTVLCTVLLNRSPASEPLYLPERSSSASSCLTISNFMTLLFSRLSCSVLSFSLHALPANYHPALFTSIKYSFVESPFSCPTRSFSASSCLIIFNSMTLLFSRLSCSFLSFSLHALPANYNPALFTSI